MGNDYFGDRDRKTSIYCVEQTCKRSKIENLNAPTAEIRLAFQAISDTIPHTGSFLAGAPNALSMPLRSSEKATSLGDTPIVDPCQIGEQLE
jgi:hypothetical protein